MPPSDLDSQATYNELSPRGRGMPVMGQNALVAAALRQKALDAAQAPPGPGQGQLSPMLPRSPQQQMQMQQGLAMMLRKRALEEQMMRQQQPMPPQPGMMPPGGMPPPQ